MNFSRPISLGEHTLQALFTKVHAPAGKFFVVLTDKGNEVASFDMVRKFDQWIIVRPAPGWAIPFQQQLSVLINHANDN